MITMLLALNKEICWGLSPVDMTALMVLILAIPVDMTALTMSISAIYITKLSLMNNTKVTSTVLSSPFQQPIRNIITFLIVFLLNSLLTTSFHLRKFNRQWSMIVSIALECFKLHLKTNSPEWQKTTNTLASRG